MTIAAATAATEQSQAAALTFDGAEKLTIPPGEEAAGDPMDLPVAPGADLFLSLYFPEETGLATYEAAADVALALALGDAAGGVDLVGP